MSVGRAPDDEREVAVWFAFERLGHAYLVHDDEGVRRELALIATLRDEAAALAPDLAEPEPSLRDRVADLLAGAAQRVFALPVVPAMVMGDPGRTEQGKAEVDESARRDLGTISVSAIVDGTELGVAISGLAADTEGRLRLYADEQGRLHHVDLVPTAPGAGFVSVTVPWTAGLPDELVVVLLPPSDD